MKNFLFLLLLSIVFNEIIAQENIKFSGLVVDASNDRPMPYTNCVILNKNVGTYTNLEGIFNFNLNNVDLQDTLALIYLGYETKNYPLSKLIKNKFTKIKLVPKNIVLNEIKVYPKPEKIKRFMKNWLRAYQINRVNIPHIALAHYREKAKYHSKYIMFTESVGYAIYLGYLKDASPLSNYKFYYLNTRRSVAKPDWNKYAAAHNQNFPNITPGASYTLNCFRRMERSGILSKKGKHYRFKLDSVFFVNGREVYSIHFSGRKEKGNIEIYTDNRRLKEIRCTTNNIRSQVINGSVQGYAILKFNYFNQKAYISSISTYYLKAGLEHWNSIDIIAQKLDKFDFNEKEYWAINETDLNPLVKYSSNKWKNLQIKPDNDYKKICQDLKSDTLSLQQQFIYNSGKYFMNRNTDDYQKTSKQFIDRLEKLF